MMKAALALIGRERKALVALVTGPGLTLSARYLGGVAIPHVWYVVVVGALTALGVHIVANDPPASASTPAPASAPASPAPPASSEAAPAAAAASVPAGSSSAQVEPAGPAAPITA